MYDFIDEYEKHKNNIMFFIDLIRFITQDTTCYKITVIAIKRR